MAIFKFYNFQLLPMDTKKVSEVGSEGYCKLFVALGAQVADARKNGFKLSSIAISMRGDMYFAPYSVTVHEYPGEEEPNKLIHGYFLKFDDIDELVDTDSGELEYRSKGNTSSKRFQLEFVFDPNNHILAIHDTKGLPARRPFIDALERLFEGDAHRLFPEHSLEIEELTTADSIEEFFAQPKKGISSYSGKITFSNSDDLDDEFSAELRPLVKQAEQEMKDKSVGVWESRYSAFKEHLMSDLPTMAKIQMILATLYGNAEATYTDGEGKKQRYHMEDYPVREPLEEKSQGVLNRAVGIVRLITKAKQRTRVTRDIVTQNKGYLESENN